MWAWAWRGGFASWFAWYALPTVEFPGVCTLQPPPISESLSSASFPSRIPWKPYALVIELSQGLLVMEDISHRWLLYHVKDKIAIEALNYCFRLIESILQICNHLTSHSIAVVESSPSTAWFPAITFKRQILHIDLYWWKQNGQYCNMQRNLLKYTQTNQ